MSEPKRILHLTLKREWFDQIAAGEKTVEQRARTPYWRARLMTWCADHLSTYPFYQYQRTFDEVHFRNGYRQDSPFMRVEWRGLRSGIGCYEILLGKVLEIRNWWR